MIDSETLSISINLKMLEFHHRMNNNRAKSGRRSNIPENQLLVEIECLIFLLIVLSLSIRDHVTLISCIIHHSIPVTNASLLSIHIVFHFSSSRSGRRFELNFNSILWKFWANQKIWIQIRNMHNKHLNRIEDFDVRSNFRNGNPETPRQKDILYMAQWKWRPFSPLLYTHENITIVIIVEYALLNEVRYNDLHKIHYRFT